MSLAYLGSQHDSLIWADIAEEAWRAHDKFGDQLDLTDLEWLAILAEEFGEAAMAVTKREVRPVNPAFRTPGTRRDLRAEVVQIAAVAARWLRVMDERLPDAD